MSMQTGVLAPNGKIYFVPFSANEIGVFDPTTEAIASIPISFAVNTAKKYHGTYVYTLTVCKYIYKLTLCMHIHIHSIKVRK